MNKDTIRKEILNKRKNISDKKDKSIIITNTLKNLDIYKKSNIIALYNSLDNEVDTSYLINNSNKTILLPRVIEDKLIFIKINNDTKYTKSKFGVIEPIGEKYLGNIDLIIVPGVSFDKERNRLGYGKGYYDKYLNNKEIYKIGICFNEQMVDLLPVDELDIKMNIVITENGVYS